MAEFGSLTEEPTWPEEASPPLVFLLDASSSFERAILENWVTRHRPQPGPFELFGISPSRRRSRREAMTLALEARANAGDNPTFVPLRVVWLPPERDGRRTFRLGDLVRFGDIRDPDPIRERSLYRRRRELVRIVLGSPATARELRARWESGFAARSSFGEFATRQAHLALERSERRVRGSRYKVPRFLREEILSRADFQRQLSRLAAEKSQPPDQVRARAARYLREIAATTNTYTVDVVSTAIHWLYRRGYRDLHYDPDAFTEVARLSEQFPVVYLPSHKSNFDHLILAYLLWENGLPPNHTAGGVNMDFFPLGPIMRRTGVFFIRRSFKENDVYRETLKAYLDYLIEKRFPLEWYLEGGRSRSGKLLAPRYGMLGYVADAYWRGKSDDVYIIPVSIAYDQIQEVGSHAAEQRGDPKERESVGWMVRAVRSFRGRYVSIHIRL
ncbi:MAG TPA: 1-acyl-sn-glycerol-3-phosphate acyltransferase, partial [Acidimicrobiia bacterium]